MCKASVSYCSKPFDKTIAVNFESSCIFSLKSLERFGSDRAFLHIVSRDHCHFRLNS